MAATNAFRDHIAAVSIGEAVTAFNNANAYLGVGDSNTAFATSQTDLQAATNKLRKAMNSTYPSRAGNVLTFQATFVEAEANWNWLEFGTFNASSGGTMMQRAVISLGTKTSAEQWRLTATLTFTV